MKTWWRDLSLGKKLHLSIQLSLLLVLPLAQMWVMDRFEEKMLEDVRLRAEDSATQSFLSLNAMMLSGTISNPDLRAAFLSKMAKRQGVTDFHLVRAPALSDRFGGRPGAEGRGDALDRAAMAAGSSQFEIIRSGKHILHVAVPFAASKDLYGTNCLRCHLVPEGTVLGTVSLAVDLAPEYVKLNRLGLVLVGGQISLQLLLFLLIGWIIRRVTGSVVELEQTMLELRDSGDFSRRAEVRGKDELGHIAQVFNGFIAQIEELYRQLASKIQALEKYHDHTEEELRIGSDIMSRITAAYGTVDPGVRTIISPATHYSGDLILTARTPDGHLHVLLADAVGHGLIAAMNLLPLSQVFNAMSKKGFAVSRIAEELNAKIFRLMPADRFVGAVLVSVDFRNRVIEVWNGGIPAPILVGSSGEVLHQWRSRNLPLGILGEEDFSAETETFHYEQEGQLFLFSDGLPEAESPDGEQFGRARIEEALMSSAEYRFDALTRSLRQHLQGGAAHDDISLALVNLSLQDEVEGLACHLSHPGAGETGSRWKLMFRLGEDELKYLDAVPLLTEIVGKIHAATEHHAALYVILSELFNNALDHGLLKLDSGLKHGADGFEHYLHLREERLNSLASASIEIEIERVEIEGRYGVKIRVTDSGDGFNHAALFAGAGEPSMSAQYGRGLALVRGVAYRIEFAGKGNEVVAYYICS
ncbi:MAG TPA: SpoIIE family protein phosphatase [Gallionella sp.]|nr:SpoIIE family protein phosphatase [Gallionella sp.]